MSEYADKYSKPERRTRVENMLKPNKGPIDASDYKVPGELDTEKKTGPCQPKPRAFAKGGKVEGKSAHHHSGRKSRDMGGQMTAAQQLRPQVPTSGLYGSGFAPTHAGMLSSAAGLKKGGTACKKAKGGEVPGNSKITGTRPTGGRLARAAGGKAKGKTNINIIIGSPKPDNGPAVPPPPSAMPPAPPRPTGGLPPAAMGAMGGLPPAGGMPPAPGAMPPPGAMPRASGGRAYPLDAAGGGGEGRLEKIKAYGPK